MPAARQWPTPRPSVPRQNLEQTPEADPEHSGPVLQRIILGARLRQFREDRQIGRKQAADTIRGSESKISRLELGRTGFKIRDVEDLLTLYGVRAKPQREAMLALAQQASQQPWWQPYRDVVPGWFEQYLSLERDAQVIRAYEPCHIPGLLQTADYARAVIENGRGDVASVEVGERVELRLRRQELLWNRQPSPPRLWAVLDEAAVRRPAGTPDIMRRQLRHLVDMAAHPYVRIFVVPFSAGQRGAVGVPFSILRFPGALLPDLVYVESFAQAAYPERPEELRHYWHLMNTLATEALSPDDTVKLLRQLG